MRTTFSFAAASGRPNSPCSARRAAGGSASPQGLRSPRLRSPALHGANVPHAFHAAVPPPPTAHKRVFDQPLLFGIHPHPPYSPGYSLLLARCGAKIRIVRLGRQLVDGIWAPVGWRIAVFVKTDSNTARNHRGRRPPLLRGDLGGRSVSRILDLRPVYSRQ
jgi:hypothetical protein